MHLLVSILMQMYVFHAIAFMNLVLRCVGEAGAALQADTSWWQSVWHTKLVACAADHKLKDYDI